MAPPRFSRRDFIPPLLPIQKECYPPFLKRKPCVELLKRGDMVDYTPRGAKSTQSATIVGVHGDCLPPYYTIRLEDGDKTEKQVEGNRIKKRRADASS